MKAIIAGVSYFTLIFALGFALGAIRILVIAPRLGSTGAVFLEVPIMLTASWILCGWLVRRFRVSPVIGARLAMGITAFALLMLAELGVSVFVFDRSPAEHVATYLSWSAVPGLAAQIAFAAMPLFRREDPSSPSSTRADASVLRHHP